MKKERRHNDYDDYGASFSNSDWCYDLCFNRLRKSDLKGAPDLLEPFFVSFEAV